jgi:hypothetical protein
MVHFITRRLPTGKGKPRARCMESRLYSDLQALTLESGIRATDSGVKLELRGRRL